MILKKINLINFKNYSEAEIFLSSTINCFSGKNGAGKTNLLDAIHYLCLCKSYFNPIDVQQIKNEEGFFMLNGEFERKGEIENIFCGLKRNYKKQFKRNDVEYKRLADHIGLFPSVIITPYDGILISDGSEERRKWVDSVISQVDGKYLDYLIDYNKVLNNRNQVLKNANDSNSLDEVVLEIYNEQLTHFGNLIFERRKQFFDEILPTFFHHFNFLSDAKSDSNIKYQSQLLTENFESGLKSHIKRDLALQRTSFGIHKDDLIFTIHQDFPLKKFGSQGEQKSFLIALKLAQYSYLKEHLSIKPLLLLDDIFDKLDNFRIERLMQMVSKENFGQIFITDTNGQRVQEIFQKIGSTIKNFEVDNGSVSEVNPDNRN